MQPASVFSQNLNNLLEMKCIQVKSLVKESSAVDYTYFHRVRRGKSNPSLNKAGEIVSALKSFGPLREMDLELWMFLTPDYFKNDHVCKPALSVNSEHLERVLTEADALGVLKSTLEQRQSIGRLAELMSGQQ